jgi:hypothetical protein
MALNVASHSASLSLLVLLLLLLLVLLPLLLLPLLLLPLLLLPLLLLPLLLQQQCSPYDCWGAHAHECFQSRRLWPQLCQTLCTGIPTIRPCWLALLPAPVVQRACTAR